MHACLVAWLLDEDVAGGDLVLIETFLLLISHVNEVSGKTWSSPASISLKGQATKRTAVKWSQMKI